MIMGERVFHVRLAGPLTNCLRPAFSISMRAVCLSCQRWVNLQSCQKESHLAMHALRHLSRSILAVTWAEAPGSEDLGSYKHLTRRNKSDGCITGLFGQKTSKNQFDIHHTTRLGRQNLQLMEHDLPKCGHPHLRTFEQWNVSGVPVFCWNLTLYLSGKLYFRRIGFPDFIQKSQMVDLQKDGLRIKILFSSTSKSGRSTPNAAPSAAKSYRFFGAEIDSPDGLKLGHPASSKQQVHDDNVIITHYTPPKKKETLLFPNPLHQTCDALPK